MCACDGAIYRDGEDEGPGEGGQVRQHVEMSGLETETCVSLADRKDSVRIYGLGRLDVGKG